MAKVDYFSEESLRHGLKKKVVRGGLAIGIAQTARIAIGLATIPILSRLLQKDDFGLIAMMAFFTNFAAMFVDSGMSMATVQREKINHQQVSNLFWIASLLGLAIAAIVAASAPCISWVYSEPRLVAITLTLACSYIFTGMTVQHQALMRRGMQFTRLSLVGIFSTIIGQSVGIMWAWRHYGMADDYWALAWTPIVMTFTQMVLSWLACSWRPSLPKRGEGTRDLVRFGANLTGFNFVNYFARNADNLLIGWWWGPSSLGYYERAYKLFLYPLQKINGPLTGVMIPALSRLVNNKPLLIKTYLRVVRAQLFILAPAVIAVAITADWWVIFLLSDEWIESIPVLRWLMIVGFVQPIMNSTSWLYISLNKTKQMVQMILVVQPTVLLAFAIGLPWGPEGVAAAYSLSGLFFRIPYALYWMDKCGVISANKIINEFRTAIPVILSVIIPILLLSLYSGDVSPATGVLLCLLVATTSWAIAISSIPYARSWLTTEYKSLMNR